jgi:hypothetical protein
MPIPLAPNTTPADASGAFALLEIIGDESKFKKRLKELQDQAKSIEQMIENSKKLDVESKNRLKEVEKLNERLELREAQLKTREDGLGKARHDTLELQESLNARQAKFDEENDKRVKAKEASLNVRAAELTEKEKIVTAAMRDLQEKLAAHDMFVATKSREITGFAENLAKREELLKQGLADLEAGKTALQAKMSKVDELRKAIQNAA